MRNFILGLAVIVSAVLGSLAIMAMASPAAVDTVPVGTIIAWGGDAQSVPANWMLCNGKVLKRKQYPALFDAIGTTWGAPNNTKFNLPDLRGRFIRGADLDSGRDPDADDREAANNGGSKSGVGSVQDDEFQNHSHYQEEHYHSYPELYSKAAASFPTGSGQYIIYSWGTRTKNTTSQKIGLAGAIKYGTKSGVKRGEETRPINAAVNFIIKVK